MKTASFTTLWGLLIALAAITAESDHDGLDGTFLEANSSPAPSKQTVIQESKTNHTVYVVSHIAVTLLSVPADLFIERHWSPSPRRKHGREQHRHLQESRLFCEQIRVEDGQHAM